MTYLHLITFLYSLDIFVITPLPLKNTAKPELTVRYFMIIVFKMTKVNN